MLCLLIECRVWGEAWGSGMFGLRGRVKEQEFLFFGFAKFTLILNRKWSKFDMNIIKFELNKKIWSFFCYSDTKDVHL